MPPELNTMYLKHYNLKEHPFGATPDPRFLFLSNTHKEAMAALAYGVQTGRGFVLLTANPGMGKTTLLFNLLGNLKNVARTAFMFQTQCSSREFLLELMADLDIAGGEDTIITHRELRRALILEAQAKRSVVVVVDEAQNLDDSVLETIRLLSDYETPTTKLLQIVLSGQPELMERIRLPHLTNLRQRVSIVTRLDRLSVPETHAYIRHRLKVAGHIGPPVFTLEACDLIAQLGQGIPRNINTLCFNALSAGFAAGVNPIPPAIIEEAEKESLFSQTVAATSPTEDPFQRARH